MLLAPAGLALRPVAAGRAWLGDLRLETRDGVRVAGLVAPGSPVYAAGLDQGDVINAVDGTPISASADLAGVLARHQPGDRVDLTYTDRRGRPITASVVLGEDPRVSIVPVEAGGGRLSAEHAAFRAAWLGGGR
jgi:predicted metalloprotease with PDZ domain